MLTSYCLTAAVLASLCAATIGQAEASPVSPCGDAVAVGQGDTLSSLAERCDVSEAALLNANPSIEGSGDLQVGGSLKVTSGNSTEQKVGSTLSTFSRRASNAIGTIAGDVGSSVQDLLDKNPDLKSRVDRLGAKVGLNGSESPATISVSPQNGLAGSNVTVTASGLPKSSPVMIGAGAPGTAYAVLKPEQTSATGTLDTTVVAPEAAIGKSSIVFVIASDSGVLARSDRFTLKQ